jgi:4-amino-4-deoxy-L-arabinose transferase-like glycosyltransferase
MVTGDGTVIADRRHAAPPTVRPRHWASIDARLVLAGIVLLAIAVRAVAIGGRLHVDDAYTWLVASQPNAHSFLRQLAATENTPLLSYLLLTPLPIDHPAVLRAPAAICGVLMCVVLYGALRRPLGARIALLAALGVAVSPFLVTYSDLARGFMLEDVALLFALWAAIRLTESESAKWSMIFVLAGAVALYTEYSAGIFLAALIAAVLLIGRGARRRIALLGAFTFASIAPWIPQMIRAQDQVGKTKLHPMFATPSLTGLRETVIRLAFGEGGGTASVAGRWLELLVIIVLACAGAIVLRRKWAGIDVPARRAITLIAVTAGLTLVGHALAPLIGVDVFTQRYITIMVPLVASLGAAVLVWLKRDWLLVAATVLLVALGVVNAARRYHGEYEPDFTPVRVAATAAHPRTVLTNTPIVLFYVRSLHPIFDRPSNLGPGLQRTCQRPCLIVDDQRAQGHGGTPRQMSGTPTTIGPYDLWLER